MSVDLSIIIPSYNTKKLTVDCVESIIKNTKEISFEIIVIDNNSTDGSTAALGRIKQNDLTIIENKKNLGFAGANNQGVKRAKGRYMLFLNSDTIVHDNVLGEMVVWMERNPRVGIATCGLKNRDGSMQETGGYFPTLLRVFSWMTIQDLPLVDRIIKPFHPKKGFYQKEREFDWVTGAFMMARREVVESVNWDEDYFMYTEDVDYCYRARVLGWKVGFVPNWFVTHLGGASGTREKTVLREFEGVKTFYKKHYPVWQYIVLKLVLKIGALGRMLLLGILRGRTEFEIYAKAFWRA